MSLKQTASKIAKPLGFILIALSTIAWILMVTILFMDYDMLETAGIMTGLFILGEVSFYIGILLLGKTYWERIKQFLMKSLHEISAKEK